MLAVVAGLAVVAVPQALAATFTVNVSGDDSDGICDAISCTLREAVTAANANAGADQIVFDLPLGSTTISPNPPALPPLAGQLTIDGTTQPGYASGGRVVVDGSSAGAGNNGFEVNSAGNVIKGLVINGFSNRNVWITAPGNTLSQSFIGTSASGTAAVGAPAFASVTVQGGSGNTIGGPAAADGNVIAGGLSIFGAAASGTVVRNNRIGVDATGTAALETAALIVDQAPGTAIFDNVVASIDVQSASGTNIRRNRIGTNAAGTAALTGAPSPNGIQLLAAPDTTIGATDGDGNVISGKAGDGIRIQQSTGVVIKSNRIGTSLDGLIAIPNGADGILVTGTSPAPSATVGSIADGDGNTIANNAGAGIAVLSSAPTGIVIRGNAIYGNGGIGIDLGSDGPTPNDTGGNPDPDTGPNGLQNFPVVANAVQSGGSVSVDVTLQSTPGTTFTVDVYVGSSSCDARTWIGTTEVTTNPDGFVEFPGLSYTSDAGEPQTVIATATGPEGTSELGACTPISGSGGGPLGSNGLIAFDANGQIWTIMADGTNRTQLTTTGGTDPAWSPDGTKITYVSGNDIWVMAADGSSKTNLTSTVDVQELGPSFSADGTRILFSRPLTLAQIPAGGGLVTALAGGQSGQNPVESPDGTKLAFDRASTIKLYDYAGGTTTDLASGGLSYLAAWAPDGSRIYWRFNNGSQWQIESITPAGTGQATVVPPNSWDPAPSPDGTKLAYGTGSPGIYVANADGSSPTLVPGTSNAELGGNAFDVSWGTAMPGGGDTAQPGPTFTVNSAADPGDGTCTVAECTLREALNAAGTGDTVAFDLPGGGVHTILPLQGLPSFYGGLLDGWSQGGAAYAGPPLIEIDGSGTAETNGLTVGGGGMVRGLAIGGFDGYGVRVDGSGVELSGNYIGTDASGTVAHPNGLGGVYVNDTDDTVIGGPTPAAGNVISGNGGHGIELPPGPNFTIKGNLIGVGADGTTPLGNDGAGVLAESCCGNDGVVGGSGPGERNVIAYNGSAGIVMDADGAMTISGNSIHDNVGLGIDLGGDGVTSNDHNDGPSYPADQDTGPNGLQNFPEISAATVAGAEVTIDYSLETTPGGTYTVEFFVSGAPDPSGYGEGARYLGSDSITLGPTDLLKSASVTLTPSTPVVAGAAISATATDAGGNTSEFSFDQTAESAAVPPLVTGLTIDGPATADAGASTVPLAGIPPAALVTPQTSGTQAAPVNQSPVNQSPVNQLPVNQLPVNQSPVNQSPVNQLPVNQSPVNQSGLDFKSLAVGPGPLGDTALATIPLLREGGWGALLAGTELAGTPLQSVTLRRVFGLSPLPEPLRPGSPNPLLFADIDFSNSPLGSLPAMTLALGQLPLSGIPEVDWCALFSGPPLNCTGSLPPSTSLLSAALEGAPVNQSPVNQSPVNQSLIDALAASEAPVNQLPVNQLPVNQLPVNQLPVNQSRILSFPVNQLPVNQSPVNQLSLNAILLANVPVNQSPVNQLPVNQLPVNQSVLVCGGVQCTGTLGNYVGKVVPGATLGDLRAALPSDVPDDWTIANLEEFGALIVGDLLKSLPQPNDLTLADVLALALFANNPESFAFETLNIFDTSLSLYADPLGAAPYTVDFTLTPDGGPTGIPSAVAVSATLPRTFAYAAGTSKLVQGPGTCGSGTPVDDPSLAQTAGNPGVTKAIWNITGNVGSSYTLCFSAAPGIVLGPQSATATAKPGGGALVTADAPEPVTVVDGTEASSNVPATAPTLSTSNLYLSYLTSASDVDYYRIPVPQAGARVTLHLSHLPTDYDLVVYGPQQTALRPASASTPPLDGAPLTDTGAELTHVTDALPSQTLDDLRLQTLPIVGVSASRGTDPEDITVLSDGIGSFYTVQVTSYNGATSSDPYMLRVTTEAPRAPATVPSRTVAGATGTALGALPAGFNTLFLVNRQRLQSFYPGTGPGTGAGLLASLASTQASFEALGFPNAVLSVDAYPAVQSAYAAWDADPGNPDLANRVVAAINASVDTVRAQANGSGLKYLVIVGGDRVIPQGRLGDFTTAANETGYADTFDRSSDLYAALHAGQMLSDDPYGTTEPVPYLNRQLYIPRLAVGRLVETPAEIDATLTRFGAFNGRLDPTTSLTTGYDFMQDGATAINASFASRFGATAAKTLISDSWLKSDLLTAFLPAGGAPAITSLNGHADHYEFAPPSVTPPFFTSGDLPLGPTSTPAASTGPLVNRLVFSMGCHSGLSVGDAVVTASTYDWPQAYSRNGVGAYLGNSGFGYGDSLIVAYSEQLDSLFAEKIAAGSTVGNALAAAKQEYFGSLGVFGVYDEKAMAEFTLYGLPMWSVTTPDGGAAPASVAPAPAAPAGGVQVLSLQAAAATPTTTAVVTDASTGLQAETFTLASIQNTAHTTPIGRYWSGPDGVQATHFRPLQPKAFVDVAGTSGHGALVTELIQQADTPNVDPAFARPIVDTTVTEPELSFGDVAFPARLQALRTFQKDGTAVQRVVLMTGQFFTGATPGSTGEGVQRLYTRIGARVLRSTSNDYVPPAFTRIDATKVGGTAAFSVDVTDLTQTGGAGVVKRVLVALRSGNDTTWKFSDLGQVGTSSTWTGGVPLTSASDQFEYFVQAVDAAGTVGVSTNKGFYFAAAAPAAPSGDVTVEPASAVPPSGWFSGSTGVVVSGPGGVTLQVSVDGGAFVDVQPGSGPTVSGDGIHTIEARGSNGGSASTIVAIDGSAPEITIATPASGASYRKGSSVTADFTCADAGSGIASCAGTVASGAAISTATTGTRTFTVSATDNVARTATKTVTYTVTDPCVGPAPPGAIVGGSGNDTINGTPGNDVIYDLRGNNKIDGKGGDDTICTGSGNDKITAGGGNDIVIDTGGNNTIDAGAGDNEVMTRTGNDKVTTGPGNDTVSDTGGNNTIDAGAGDNRVTSGTGNDKITTGPGNDTVTDTGGNNAIEAGAGDNRVTSGTGNDTITTGGGNDIVSDSGGNNSVDVGGGRDTVTTGTGNDAIEGGAQDDTIDAGNGNNTVNGSDGNDRIRTGSGNDKVDGGNGYDGCNAGAGNNSVKNCEYLLS